MKYRALRVRFDDPEPEPIVPDGTPAFLTEEAVAKLLGVARRTIRSWRAAGRLRGLKIGCGRNGTLRFARRDVERFLASAAARR